MVKWSDPTSSRKIHQTSGCLYKGLDELRGEHQGRDRFFSVIFLWFPYDLFVKLRQVWMLHSSSSIQRWPFSEFPRLQDVSHSTFRWACKCIRISDQSICLQIYSGLDSRTPCVQDQKYHVNFDADILQLIRESRAQSMPSGCQVDAERKSLVGPRSLIAWGTSVP